MSSPGAPLNKLIRRWQAGWGVCRGLRRAAETPYALNVTLKLPGRYRELIALNGDDDAAALGSLAEEVTQASQANWLTVPCTNPAAVNEVVSRAGLVPVDEPKTLMTIPLRQQRFCATPHGYNAGTKAQSSPITALATTSDGEVAASGTMAVVGDDAVAHNVRTDEAHRRRGLASVVMAALVQQAMDDGATTGLLVASSQGTSLYESLGWTARCTVLSFHRALTS